MVSPIPRVGPGSFFSVTGFDFVYGHQKFIGVIDLHLSQQITCWDITVIHQIVALNQIALSMLPDRSFSPRAGIFFSPENVVISRGELAPGVEQFFLLALKAS